MVCKTILPCIKDPLRVEKSKERWRKVLIDPCQVCISLSNISPGDLCPLLSGCLYYFTLCLLSPNLSQQWLVRAVWLEFLKPNRTYGLSLRKWEITAIETGSRMLSLIRKEKQILCKFCYSEQKQIIRSHPRWLNVQWVHSSESENPWNCWPPGSTLGFPGDLRGKEFACQCRKLGFSP